MGKVLRKLQSNNGATLMLALLFFIVCAVTGSMILTSAGVAAGRLENMKRRDQNYFAVKSAVNMLKAQMLYYNDHDNPNPITFNETLKITETTYKDENKEDKREVAYSNSGNVGATIPNEYVRPYDYVRPLLINSNVSYYSEKAAVPSDATDEDKEEAFFKPWYRGTEGNINESPAVMDDPRFKNYNPIGNSDDNLNVDIIMSLNSLGELVFKVKNSDTINGKKNREIYYMTLTMDIDVTCERSITTNEPEDDDGDDDDDDGDGSGGDSDDEAKESITEYKNTYKYTFKFKNIQKGHV